MSIRVVDYLAARRVDDEHRGCRVEVRDAKLLCNVPPLVEVADIHEDEFVVLLDDFRQRRAVEPGRERARIVAPVPAQHDQCAAIAAPGAVDCLLHIRERVLGGCEEAPVRVSFSGAGSKA